MSDTGRCNLPATEFARTACMVRWVVFLEITIKAPVRHQKTRFTSCATRSRLARPPECSLQVTPRWIVAPPRLLLLARTFPDSTSWFALDTTMPSHHEYSKINDGLPPCPWLLRKSFNFSCKLACFLICLRFCTDAVLQYSIECIISW